MVLGDYKPEPPDRPPFARMPHETSFGIVRQDGSYKPVAHALSAFAQEKRKRLVMLLCDRYEEEVLYAAMPASIETAYADYLCTT